MKLTIELSDVISERLASVAVNRGVTPTELAKAYIEDWFGIEYAELVGRHSRRSIYRDGPVAFDTVAAEAAMRIEADVLDIERRRKS
jgi:hypothetical protein